MTKPPIDTRHQQVSQFSRLVPMIGHIEDERPATTLADELNRFLEATGYKVRAVLHRLDEELYIEMRPTISGLFESQIEFAALTDRALDEIVCRTRNGAPSKATSERRRIERALGAASLNIDDPIRIVHNDQALVGVRKVPAKATIRTSRRADAGFPIVGFDAQRKQVLLKAKRGCVWAGLDRKNQSQEHWEELLRWFVPAGDFVISAEQAEDGSYFVDAATLLDALKNEAGIR